MFGFEQAYWRGCDLMVSGDPERAIAHYRELLQHDLEPWQQSACHADLSLLHFAMHDAEEGAAELEAAIGLGFDDVIAMRENGTFRRNLEHPRVRAAVARMSIAPEDEAELRWLRDEAVRVAEETMTLITGNGEAQPATIPTRTTNSVAVRTRRLVLAQVQQEQAEEVRRFRDQ